MLAGLRWRGEPYLNGAIGCYVLLIASQMLTSWRHESQTPYTHLVQPLGALLFAGTVAAYGWNTRSRGNPELAGAPAMREPIP
jgi:hypothetical protein